MLAAVANPMISGLAGLTCAAGLVLAGCASGSSSGASGTSSASDSAGTSSSTVPSANASTPASPSAPVDDAVEVVVSVRDGKVRPPTQRVKVEQGADVRLVLTSDIDDQVHVHGYDLEAELPAGRAVTLEFAADQAGLFEVETHESGLALVQLEVR